MEISLVEELNCKTREAALAPHFINSSAQLGSTKLVGTDDEQQGDKCEHFSIRGYVAEVRKRDMKLCWPFNAPYGDAPSEQFCALPPLPVPKFRWWSCQSCLKSQNQPNENVISNVPAMSIKNDRKKMQHSFFLENATVPSHPSHNQQESQENFIQGRSVQAQYSIKVIGGEFQQYLRFEKKRDESVATDLIEEGSNLPNGGYHCCKENQNQPRKLTLNRTEGRACQQGQAGDANIIAGASTLVNHIGGEDASKTANGKTGVLESVHEIADAEVSTEVPMTPTKHFEDSGHEGSQSLSGIRKMKKPRDSVAQTYSMTVGLAERSDGPTAIAGNMSETQNTAESDMHTNDYLDRTENHAIHCASVGDLHHQKAHKLRSLNDIIRSEKLLVSEKVCNSSQNPKASQKKKSTGRALRLKAKYLHHTSHTAKKGSVVKPIKRKGTKEPLNDEDEGPSLMHWLKMAKKSRTRKRDAGTNGTMNGGDISKCTADVSPGNYVLYKSGPREKKQSPLVDRKQSRMQQTVPAPFCFTSQQDSMKGKGKGKEKMITEDILVGKLHSGSIYPKLNGEINVQKRVPHNLEIRDITLKNVKMRKRASLIEYKDFRQKHILKENIADLHGAEKVVKKRRTTLMSEKEESDDFPMDIVELLAKNQHERHLTNAEAAAQNLQHLSGMAEKMQKCNIQSVTEGFGNITSDVILKSIYKQVSLPNHKENIAWSAVRSYMEAGNRLQSCHSSIISKQNPLMDLNSREAVCASSGLYTVLQRRGHPMNEAEIPAIGTKNNQIVPKLQQKKEVMQDPGSSNRSCSMKGQSSFRTGCQMPALLDFGPNKDQAYADFNRVPELLFPPGNLMIGTHKADCREPVNLTYSMSADLLNRNQASKSSNRNQQIPPTTSVVAQGNQCLSTMSGLLKLCSNERVPPMHLLRVMESATSSCQPLHPSMVNSQTQFIHESDFYGGHLYDKALGAENCMKTSDASRCPLTVGKLDQDQHPGICRPIRPIPRLGVLGSVLQKEISSLSNACKVPFGFRGGCSNQLASLGTNGIEKEPSLSVCHTKALSDHTSIPSNANSAPALSSIRSLPYAGCNPISDKMSEVGNMIVVTDSCDMEVCVLSRNPAEFSLPDENNIYMRGALARKPKKTLLRELKWCPVDTNGQKRHKKMKLSALKGSMRT